MKSRSLLVLIPLLSLLISGLLRADPIGHTYTVGITGFGANGGGYLNEQEDFLSIQFAGDGSFRSLGDNLFGEIDGGGLSLDEFAVSDSVTSVSAFEKLVTVRIVARDKSTLNLTNWIADGATTNGTDVFTETALELGDFNGGTTRITPTSFASLSSSEFRIVGTDGFTYGNFNIDSPEVAGGLGGAAGVFFGIDVSTFEVANGVEVAGYELRYIYSVPEPASTAFLGLLAVGLITRRKR